MEGFLTAIEEKPMEDLPTQAGLALRSFRDFLPETLEEAEELAASIERAVQQETGHGVSDLRVVVHNDSVVLKGRCDSYYCKQLAQHVAMNLSRGERLVNGIEVMQ
jgi:hypothetical protein